MKSISMRIVFIPEITDVYVADDGQNYDKIVTEEMFQEHEDYVREISVIPGVSKIKFVAVPDGVERFYWTFSDDDRNDGSRIGDGPEMNTCVLSVPANTINGTNIYIEEGHEEVDFGYDLRDLYFKNDGKLNSPGRTAFEIVSEKVCSR